MTARPPSIDGPPRRFAPPLTTLQRIRTPSAAAAPDDAARISGRFGLAAVEPAAAEAGEDAGHGGETTEEVQPVSLGEHDSTSFRSVFVFKVVGADYASDTLQRGIHGVPTAPSIEGRRLGGAQTDAAW